MSLLTGGGNDPYNTSNTPVRNMTGAKPAPGPGGSAAWTAPTLTGGKFANMADAKAWRDAVWGYSHNLQVHSSGGNALEGYHDPQGFKNAQAAADFGLKNGFVTNADLHPAGQGGGFIGGSLKFIGDSALKIATMPPVAAALTAGTASAFAAPAASGSGTLTAAEQAQILGTQAADFGIAGGGGVLGAAPGGLSAAEGAAIAGGAGAGAGAGTATNFGISGANGVLGAAPTGSPSLLGGADVINTNAGAAADPLAAPAAEGAPSALGPYNGANTVGTQGFEGAGPGGGPSAAPSLNAPANGDVLGKVGTFARDALAIGGLLGGLAGLQGGKSPAAPEQPPPVPQATSSQIGTQADVKADMQKGAAPGGPNAGIDTTWLTGMGGVPEDQLRLGRSTLLGQ